MSFHAIADVAPGPEGTPLSPVTLPAGENHGDKIASAFRRRVTLLLPRLSGFEVFGLEDLAAIETFHVVHAVSTGNDLGAGMLTSGLHRNPVDEFYSIQARGVVKAPLGQELQFG